MGTWAFRNPVEVLAGEAVLDRLAEFLKGPRVLLLTTPGFLGRAALDTIRDRLRGFELRLCADINPNPDLDALQALAQCERAFSPHGIVALGGGSVIDSAKVLSLLLPGPEDCSLRGHLEGTSPIDFKGSVPLVALPTTSGTGAEVTPFATVWDHRHQKKYSLEHPLAYPQAALLDPGLTRDLPRSETLYTGLDVLSHALESLWNKRSNPMSRTFALSALRTAIGALPTTVERGSDLSARQEMQFAALMAGQAIAMTRTAVAHALSYPLTLGYGVPHGLACGFTLGRILELCRREGVDLALPTEVSEGVAALLEKLGVDRAIRGYLDREALLGLLSQTGNPERSNNFVLPLDRDRLRFILLGE